MNCINCGVEIFPPKRKHCSVSCYQKLQHKKRYVKRNIRPRKCRGCGAVFTGRSNYQHYCTPDCRFPGRKHRERVIKTAALEAAKQAKSPQHMAELLGCSRSYVYHLRKTMKLEIPHG